MRFTILLPSAQGKQPGGNPLAPDMFDYRSSNTFNFFSDLNAERRTIIDALQKHIEGATEEELEALFGIKGSTLEEAVRVNRGIYDGPLMAAIDRYGPGTMYQAMDFPELPTGAQRRLLENGVIFSGLFGLLRPDDLIPNYRLKMSHSLDEVGKVSSFWREPLSQELNTLLEGQAVWDLLSGSHAVAWDDQGAYHHKIEVKFYKEKENGDLRPITHKVKTLRGALVHFIVTEMADNVDALEDWESPGGYELDREASELDGAGGGTAVMISRPGWQERRERRRAARMAEQEEKRARRRARDDDDE